jgi:hypothetical protein
MFQITADTTRATYIGSVGLESRSEIVYRHRRSVSPGKDSGALQQAMAASFQFRNHNDPTIRL